MNTQGHEGGHAPAPAPEQSARLTYTVPESARLVGISPALLWRLIAEGRVPVLRLGRRTLVTRQTIERIVADGSQPEDTAVPPAFRVMRGRRRVAP